MLQAIDRNEAKTRFLCVRQFWNSHRTEEKGKEKQEEREEKKEKNKQKSWWQSRS